MKDVKSLLSEIENKYGEWLETIPDSERNAWMMNITATLLLKERENNDYLRSRIFALEHRKEVIAVTN